MYAWYVYHNLCESVTWCVISVINKGDERQVGFTTSFVIFHFLQRKSAPPPIHSVLERGLHGKRKGCCSSSNSTQICVLWCGGGGFIAGWQWPYSMRRPFSHPHNFTLHIFFLEWTVRAHKGGKGTPSCATLDLYCNLHKLKLSLYWFVLLVCYIMNSWQCKLIFMSIGGHRLKTCPVPC